MEKSKDFDKYFYYHESVQSPEQDVEFLARAYKDYRGRLPENCVLREDFCGTFAVCCEWVKQSPGYEARGIDLEPETLDYGKNKYHSKLDEHQKQRVEVAEKNVLDKDLPTADVVAALNFSYFIFKDRKTLGGYFQNVFNSLNDKGVLVLDCFGGSKCYEENEEETEYEEEGFSYYWDQDSYDPVTNFAQFYIHFQRDGEKKREKCFSYDWRMWSIPEIKDLLYEVGFKEVDVYWEGTDDDGDGDGNFTRVSAGEDCESWVCYIAAAK